MSAGAAAAPAILGQRARRPNVLFILADEWRAQATGYNGDANVRAPVLDRLEAQCVNFETAVSGTPVCCPYRASLMTGQYPLTNGVFINDVELKPNGPTMGETFSHERVIAPGTSGSGISTAVPTESTGAASTYIPPEKRFGFDYWKACECTHDYNHSLYYEGNDQDAEILARVRRHRANRRRVRFIERQAKTRRPVLHGAVAGSAALSAGDGAGALPGDVPRTRNPTARRMCRRTCARKQPSNCAATTRTWRRSTTASTRLLASLDRARIAEDTIVVFTSDHGDMMLSQGLTTKLHPWDESIRVPFLVRYPREFGRKGRRIRTPLNSPDILPTLLGLADIPFRIRSRHDGPRWRRAAAPRGEPAALISLPVPTTEARRYGFAEYRGAAHRTVHVCALHPRAMAALRQQPRIRYQMHNLCGKPESRELQQRLDRMLDAELKRRKDDFLPAAEYVKRAGLGHYREVNVPVGRHPSPWGDWDSTLTAQ